MHQAVDRKIKILIIDDATHRLLLPVEIEIHRRLVFGQGIDGFVMPGPQCVRVDDKL